MIFLHRDVLFYFSHLMGGRTFGAKIVNVVRKIIFLRQLKLRNGRKKQGGQVGSLSCLFEPPTFSDFCKPTTGGDKEEVFVFLAFTILNQIQTNYCIGFACKQNKLAKLHVGRTNKKISIGR